LQKKEIPRSPRNDLVAELAYKLLVRIGADKLPIDLDDILAEYPKIKLIKFTDYKKHVGVVPAHFDFDRINARIDKDNDAEPDPAKHKDHLEAFTLLSEKTNVYYIYYDDRIRNEPRVRWSICHELGHILTGHLADYELTTTNFTNISDKQVGALEIEAHMFASELLAPSPIMHIIRNKLTIEQISLLCDISIEAAQKKKWRMQEKKYSSYIENHQMMLNFSHFIFDAVYWGSVYSVFHKRIELHPRLTDGLRKECRVCPSCHAFVHSGMYSRCQYCGQELETMTQYSRRRILNIREPNLEGVIYPFFEDGLGWQALFCPRCKSFSFTSDDKVCPVCQTPLYNYCLVDKGCFHHHNFSVECRKCPYCGGEASYSELYEGFIGCQIPPPSRYQSFLRYDEWGYVRFLLLRKLGSQNGMRLYAILSESVVYTDYDTYVLVFTGDVQHMHVLLGSMPIIKGFIEDYCLSHVKEIYLFYYDRIQDKTLR